MKITGQYGRFYRQYGTTAWYKDHVRRMEELAQSLGFEKVSQCKLAVVKTIKDYIAGGGFMFAMCSATDTYDIALAADGVDICERIYDGDGADPNAQEKLDFSKTLAFQDFRLIKDPLIYEHSSIDNNEGRNVPADQDYFTLFDFSAKWDPIPTMLTQCQTRTAQRFHGTETPHLYANMSNPMCLSSVRTNRHRRFVIFMAPMVMVPGLFTVAMIRKIIATMYMIRRRISTCIRIHQAIA